MKQEDWTTKLRERLSDYEQPAPADAWEQIERRLPASRPPRRTAMRRWLAAAAVALLLGGAGMVYYQTDQPKPTDIQPKPVAKTMKENHETMKPTAQPPTVDRVPPSEHRLTAVAMPAERLAEPETTAMEPTPVTAIATTPADTTPKTKTEQPRHSGANIQRPHVTMPSTKKSVRQADGNLGFGLLAMNTMGGNSTATNGVFMSHQMEQRFSDAYTAYKGNRRAAPVLLTDFEERSTYKMPFRFGLTVSYRLAKDWQIETGVVYTHTSAAFVKQMRRNTVTTEEALHYVGIPLRVGFTVWERNRLRFYASGGGEIDFNVKALRETEGIKQDMQHDRPQFSVQAAAGAQLNILPQTGIYVEPGVTWYPNNGSQVDNIFKDRPLQPTLQFGLRYTVK